MLPIYVKLLTHTELTLIMKQKILISCKNPDKYFMAKKVKQSEFDSQENSERNLKKICFTNVHVLP